MSRTQEPEAHNKQDTPTHRAMTKPEQHAHTLTQSLVMHVHAPASAAILKPTKSPHCWDPSRMTQRDGWCCWTRISSPLRQLLSVGRAMVGTHVQQPTDARRAQTPMPRPIAGRHRTPARARTTASPPPLLPPDTNSDVCMVQQCGDATLRWWGVRVNTHTHSRCANHALKQGGHSHQDHSCSAAMR
jgi:hypothetical protein